MAAGDLNYYPFIVGKLHIVNCQPPIAAILGGFTLSCRASRGNHSALRVARDIEVAARPPWWGGGGPEVEPPAPPPED